MAAVASPALVSPPHDHANGGRHHLTCNGGPDPAHLPPNITSPHSAFQHHDDDTSIPSMDTLELAPGHALGPFRLGDSLWHVLDLLRSRKAEAPKVDVSWDPDNAPTTAVTVHAGPVALLFPSPAQRLTHIHVADLATADVTLTYEGTVLASRSHPLTRAGVAYALGPTYNDAAQRLAYPGVVFDAGAETAARDARVSAVSVMAREGETPLGADGLRSVSIKPGHGATLTLADPVHITLGETSAQDILLDLGPPLRKYWKEDDRLDRVWGANQRPAPGHDATLPTACFWNYFQYGLDVLVIDGVVTKLIAHSNIPGTPEFQTYARCPWTVETGPGPLDMTATAASFRSQVGGGDEQAPDIQPNAPIAPTASAPKKNKKKKKDNGDDESRAPSTGSSPPRAGVPSDAMVLDRSVEGGLDGVVGLARSQLVGLDGLVLEIDEGSGAVAAVQVRPCL